MKVFLESIGCRLNQSEIEMMARQLLAAGHEIVTEAGHADKIIVNTCIVTKEAAKDSRSRIRRLHRQNLQAEIVLTGCYAAIAPEQLDRLDGVEQVIDNNRKDQLVQIIAPDGLNPIPLYDREPLLREYLERQAGKTRAFIKAQDGCDSQCTFCITTIARGSARSRSIGEIVSEVQLLTSAGYQEAVLTGVHLGSYGKDLGRYPGLADVVKAVLEHTDIPRLRLSSLEPWDIEEDFFDLWENPRLLPHLHLPLQSGSDQILRRMGRKTSRKAFRDLVRMARERIPDLNVSTDLIAGFPGESEDDFDKTCDYVRELGFARLHVFTFSPRPGTVAGKMQGQIPQEIRKRRARELIAVGKELSLVYHSSFVGRTVSVLWEYASGFEEEGKTWYGYSENFIRVWTRSKDDLSNRIVPALVSEPKAEGMQGSILGTQAR